MQYHLLKIGNALGYDVIAASNDRSKSHSGNSFSFMSLPETASRWSGLVNTNRSRKLTDSPLRRTLPISTEKASLSESAPTATHCSAASTFKLPQRASTNRQTRSAGRHVGISVAIFLSLATGNAPFKNNSKKYLCGFSGFCFSRRRFGFFFHGQAQTARSRRFIRKRAR